MPHESDRTATLVRGVRRAFGATALACASSITLAAQQPPAPTGITRTDLLKQALPPGDFRTVEAVMVELAPGASAAMHRHDVAVLAYVIEGTIENRFNGGVTVQHRAGESWWEAPGTVHNVARNPSTTQRTRFLVVYVAEAGKANTVRVDTARTVPR